MSGMIVEGIVKAVEAGGETAKKMEGVSAKAEIGQEISETSLNELGTGRIAMIPDMGIMKEVSFQSLNLEDIPEKSTEIGQEINEASLNELETERTAMIPDMGIIKEVSLQSLMENNKEVFQNLKEVKSKAVMDEMRLKSSIENVENEIAEGGEGSSIEKVGLTEGEKEKIREEKGWSTEIIDGIQNMDQYEILKNANLVEAEINGKKCLIKENLDLDFPDPDNEGITNRDRIALNLAPLDSETGKPIELHHLGQNADSPLVELTEEEHRTGEYIDGKKNQSLWHDNTRGTEVHGEGNSWNQERKAHWKARAENSKG